MKTPPLSASREGRILAKLITSSKPCFMCGTWENLVAHHEYVPRQFGGPNSASNLVSVCRRCHPEAERRSKLRAYLAGLEPQPREPSPLDALEALRRRRARRTDVAGTARTLSDLRARRVARRIV